MPRISKQQQSHAFNFGTAKFFHDSVQYLAKSGWPFIGANIHKLSHFWALIADL